MKIGLLIAIERELEAFLASGEERTEETVAGKTVYHTRMEGHDVYALQSGCGEIDAASGTTLLIVRYGCEMVVNFGVAGALAVQVAHNEYQERALGSQGLRRLLCKEGKLFHT